MVYSTETIFEIHNNVLRTRNGRIDLYDQEFLSLEGMLGRPLEVIQGLDEDDVAVELRFVVQRPETSRQWRFIKRGFWVADVSFVGDSSGILISMELADKEPDIWTPGSEYRTHQALKALGIRNETIGLQTLKNYVKPHPFI